LDLGAAPGGWCQVVNRLRGAQTEVFAIDLLPMEPIPGVTFFQGDFTEDAGLEAIKEFLGDQQADLVISDMAPNLSGMKAVDLPKSVDLVELAIHCADDFLVTGGHFLAKAFEGEGIDTLRREIRTRYEKQVNIKPKASRGRSKEIYLLGLGKKP
jgi:23S rRNA (uridine2552-2'-O)-methyltransferase